MPNQKSIQENLLLWYKKNARDLPWRRTKDPYKIWVSEIMLQQTQVDTVIPYYDRWLKRFPTIESLAKAPLSNVMKLWAGLGYYRRARMLHEGAKQVHRLGGILPNSAAELIKLPGIGRYTAGAIASIAFDQKAPIVDGNVIRILSRIYAINSDIGKPDTVKKIWQIAEEVLPGKHIGDFNQSMMELGATVCLPENPKCLPPPSPSPSNRGREKGRGCPVRSICAAFKQNLQSEIPVNKNKIKLEKIKTAALVLRQNGKVLIQKQAEKERWGGLWMFPHWKDKKSMVHDIEKFGLNLKPKMKVRHGFTKYLVTLEVFESESLIIKGEKLDIKNQAHRWVNINELSQFAMPSPHQKIAAEILKK